MPPIKLHIDDEIVPKKDPQSPEGQDPTKTTPDAYPAAQPGAAVAPPPAPTPYSIKPRAEPTRTTSAAPPNPYAPPMPQPGAVPVPLHQAGTHPNTLPPPPQAGQTSAQHQGYIPPHAPPPAPNPRSNDDGSGKGAAAPPPATTKAGPTQGYLPPHAPPPAPNPVAGAGPTTYNMGPVNPINVTPAPAPSGYQQNAFAQDLSPSQRVGLEQQERREGVAGMGVSGGGVGGGVGGQAWDETAGNVWNTVKGWASVAGQKLAETEEEVWKRINSQQK